MQMGKYEESDVRTSFVALMLISANLIVLFDPSAISLTYLLSIWLSCKSRSRYADATLDWRVKFEGFDKFSVGGENFPLLHHSLREIISNL